MFINNTHKHFLTAALVAALAVSPAYAQKKGKKVVAKPKTTVKAKPAAKTTVTTKDATPLPAEPTEKQQESVQEEPVAAPVLVPKIHVPTKEERAQAHADSICRYEQNHTRDSILMANGDATSHQVPFPEQPVLWSLALQNFDAEFVLVNYLLEASKRQSTPEEFVPITGMITKELERTHPMQEGTPSELQDYLLRCIEQCLTDSALIDRHRIDLKNAFNHYGNALQAIERKEIIASAQKGDDDAQYKLGFWFFRGENDMPRDYKKAVEWWQKSAGQQNAHALSGLAECYERGLGVERDSTQAVKLYDSAMAAGDNELIENMEKRARRGNLFCQMYLVECYSKGKGVNANENKVIEYYTMAAESGNRDAQNYLGLYYREKGDYPNAIKYFQPAAQQGDVISQYWMGKMSLSTSQNEQEKRTAFEYLQKAANAEHTEAMYEAAECLLNGVGTPRIPTSAIAYLRKAGRRGHTEACWMLGKAYVQSTGVTQNYEQALYWFSKAVAKGHPCTVREEVQGEANFLLYLDGMKAFVVDKNFEEANRQFRALEKAENVMGTVMQAAILCSPDNPKRNDKKALKLLAKVTSVTPLAYHYMGKIYESGTEQDAEQAVKNYEMAADALYPPSLCRMGDYYYEGNSVVDKNISTAIKYFRKAMDEGRMSTKAVRRLSACYEKGTGVTADPQKVEELNLMDTKDNVPDLLRQL